MWKKEDSKLQEVPEISTVPTGSSSVAPKSVAPINPAPVAREASQPGAMPQSPRAAAGISQGIRIKGEVSGSEDLFVDGYVEGKLSLAANASLTIGVNGEVKADITAREVIVRGRVEGKVAGRERVQLASTGRVNGEVQTERLAIEDGALLRGKVEAGKFTDQNTEARAAAASSGKSSNNVTVSSGVSAN